MAILFMLLGVATLLLIARSDLRETWQITKWLFAGRRHRYLPPSKCRVCEKVLTSDEARVELRDANCCYLCGMEVMREIAIFEKRLVGELPAVYSCTCEWCEQKAPYRALSDGTIVNRITTCVTCGKRLIEGEGTRCTACLCVGPPVRVESIDCQWCGRMAEPGCALCRTCIVSGPPPAIALKELARG